MKKAGGTSALPTIAAKLATLLPRERLHPEVMAWATKPGRRAPWAVAVSGGADSLALLLLTWAHWPERRERLVALHFNHRLRGRESAADEKFCRRVCGGLTKPGNVGRVVRIGRSIHRD